MAQTTGTPKQYAERDIQALDRKGGYYLRHLMAMTSEDLHSKSDIAAELAWRDAKIERLEAELQNRSNEPDMMASDAYHHCADMIEPYLGDQCGPDTLIPSVCESLMFLIGEWQKLPRIESVIKEWEKGCSNTMLFDEQPEDCSECTKGAIDAIKSTVRG